MFKRPNLPKLPNIKQWLSLGTGAKVGMPPGTLVYTGGKKSVEPKYHLVGYHDSFFEEEKSPSLDQIKACKDSDSVNWIDIAGLQDGDLLRDLGGNFGIHHLVLEDILNPNQRPKMEIYDGYIYFALKMISYNETKGCMEFEQLNVVLIGSVVLTFHEEAGDAFSPVYDRLRRGVGRIRKMGASYLVYALMDLVVDYYMVVLGRLAEKMDLMEEAVITDAESFDLSSIYHLKRELIALRRAIWPLREEITVLLRDDNPLFDQDVSVFLRDLNDHTVHALEVVDNFRDMTSGLMDLYLSTISHRMNQVMKVLTIIATIFIPITFIAGIYGMNFENMPELKSPWGYPMMLMACLGVVIVMLVYFRKKRWL